MKKIILAVAVAAVASMAIVSSVSAGSKAAPAGVERHQTQSMTITAVQPEGAVGQWGNVWTHTYNVTLNPCDGSFSGTGTLSGTSNGFYSNETVTGHLNGNKVSLTASRPDGVEYSLSNAPLDNNTVTLATSNPVAPWALEFKVSKTMGAPSSFKSHGEYVSSGGVDDAAHSCIGTPKKGPGDSVVGSILYKNDSYGWANFSFAGLDEGASADDKGSAFYADKSGHYVAKATSVNVNGPTSATMSLRVTSSTHPDVPVGFSFTVTLHEVPGASDYFTFEGVDKQFGSKLGNINVNYR